MRTLSLPWLFLVSACAMLVSSLAIVSPVSLLILHGHWTGLSLGFIVYLTLQTAAGTTLGERGRRREAASVIGVDRV